jgi:hypothetical protein
MQIYSFASYRAFTEHRSTGHADGNQEVRSASLVKCMEIGNGTVREVVGVFSHHEDFQDAVDELLSTGFHRAELSMLASEHTVQEKLGHLYAKVGSLVDDPTAPRTAYVSPEAIGDAEGGVIGALMYVGAVAAAGAVVASGGTLAAAISAAAVTGGAGGFIGSLLARWVGDHHARYLQEQIVRGGLLLWVRTPNVDDELRAAAILRKHSGRDVHAHTFPAELDASREAGKPSHIALSAAALADPSELPPLSAGACGVENRMNRGHGDG